jgi:hypothetical protein
MKSCASFESVLRHRLLISTWLISLVLLRPLGSGGATADSWPFHSLVGMEVGPTGAQFSYSDTNDTRYCSKLDGRDIVRHCAQAGCEYVVIWARDGDYAYYNSKLLLKAPGLGARDPLREAVEEGRKQQLPIIAYCVVQQAGHYLAAHPQWQMRDHQGNPIARFCYNSAYLEAMKGILEEQLAYGVQGFHIDMLDQGFGPPCGCWCDSCRKQFQAEYQCPMPKGITWDEDWDRMLEFRYHSSQRFERALYAHLKSLNPDVTVDFNYHGNPPFSWEVGQRPVQHAGNSDFVTGETGIWGFSALTVGLNAEFYRAATPGNPFQIAISRDARCYHNQTVRPLADLRWELFTLLSHGGFVTVVDKLGFDGWLDPVCYERLGQVFREAQAKRPQFHGQAVARAGLFFSSRTRDWYGREKPADYFLSFQGAHEAMVYEHIPWGIVLDENVTLPVLKRFPVIILPNAAILSDKEVDLFRQYVVEGGKLIVTGQSGCWNRLGRLREHSSLESLTGARFVHKLDSLDNWFRFPPALDSALPARFAPGGRLDWPFLVKGPAIVCEPTTATAVGQLMKPYRTVRQQQGREGTDWPMSPETNVGPALLINSVGRGAVLTFTGSPDFATASEHHIPEARALLRAAVEFLDPKPRLRIAAPATVEAVVADDPAASTLRVQLVAYNAPPQTTPASSRPFVLPALIEEAPIYRVTVELDRPIESAAAWNKTTVLNRHGQAITATVNDIHEILTLRY